MKKTKPNLHSLTEKEHITLIPTLTHIYTDNKFTNYFHNEINLHKARKL